MPFLTFTRQKKVQNSNFSCFVVGVIWGENIYFHNHAQFFNFSASKSLSLSLSVLIWQPSSPFYIYFCTVWCVEEKIASKRDRDEIEKKEKNKQDAKKIPKNIYANPFSHFSSMMMMMKMMMCALMGGIFI